MTAQAPPELAARLFTALFTALFTDYDLIAVDGTAIAVPKDGSIPVFTGTTLSKIALQIASHQERGR